MPQLFPLPDSSGLKPLTLPESIASNLNSGDGGHLPQKAPSPDAVDRFQKAMSTPIQPISRLAAAIAAAPAREQPPVTHAAPQTDPSPSVNQPSNVGFQPPAAAKPENTELPDVVQVATSDHPVESRSFEVFSGNSHTVPTTENRVASTTESRVAPTTENRVAPTTDNHIAPTTESHATPTTGTVEHVAEDISVHLAAKVPAKGYTDHEKPIADIGSSPAPAVAPSLQPSASPREAMPREAVQQAVLPHDLPKSERIASGGELPTSDFGPQKTPELQVKTPEIQTSGSNAPDALAKTPEIQPSGANAPEVLAKAPEIQAQDPKVLEVQTPAPKAPEIQAATVSNAERPDLSAVKVQDPVIETAESEHQAAKPAILAADTPIPAVDKPTPGPIEVQDLRRDAQSPGIEVAEIKHQATKPAALPAEKPAKAAEKPAPMVDKPALVADRPIPQDDMLQATKVEDVVIPIAVPMAQDSAPIAAASATIEIDPSAASARTSELTEAAAAVAETIKVTPSLVRGDGEVVIRLKPNVLDGSEIRLEARGSEVTIDIRPASADVAQAVERSQAQFAQQLAERMPSFQFTVAVAAAKPSTDRKSTSNETT